MTKASASKTSRRRRSNPAWLLLCLRRTTMFGYPMSAPAGAPGFWDPDPGMTGMDMAFSAAGGGGDIFQTAPNPAQRPNGIAPVGRIQPTLPHPPAEPGELAVGDPRSARRLEALRAGSRYHHLCRTAILFSGNYPPSMDDPFGIVTPGVCVDPGLLFSRPPSSSMDTAATFKHLPAAEFSAPAAPQTSQGSGGRMVSIAPMRSELRRSASVKELATTRQPERALASSPIKQTNRPSLHRSYSESRGEAAGRSRSPYPSRYWLRLSSLPLKDMVIRE